MPVGVHWEWLVNAVWTMSRSACTRNHAKQIWPPPVIPVCFRDKAPTTSVTTRFKYATPFYTRPCRNMDTLFPSSVVSTRRYTEFVHVQGSRRRSLNGFGACVCALTNCPPCSVCNGREANHTTYAVLCISNCLATQVSDWWRLSIMCTASNAYFGARNQSFEGTCGWISSIPNTTM